MKIENFSYTYGTRTIFDQVDLYFEDCQLNFILGENGVGKSTLLDCIADVDGKRGNNFIGFPKPNEIAYLSQGNNFNFELTVQDILQFMKQLHGIISFKVPVVIKKILHVKFGNLSGGERRILLVFINTIIDKDLYIFDEPESGVDLKHAQEIFDWFRELTEQGKTVIITTHKLDNIYDTDNVIYLKNPREVLSDSYLKVKSRMAF
ncbi:AAA family ATPase [Companilactobacillus kimchiensis]|uniref:ABC-type cobalt transport system, ATPase component n=1 Tax=Companilactobacillus kimchiensis TaxID=993692 RepID=A0A0R2LI97_9LACO|nr:AAA family ATPase [Companilactobacillus kimchiensis]KRN99308.1 ABC-type cobalt transport system, ATPase component [Companilactobacillus kimchiensis]